LPKNDSIRMTKPALDFFGKIPTCGLLQAGRARPMADPTRLRWVATPRVGRSLAAARPERLWGVGLALCLALASASFARPARAQAEATASSPVVEIYRDESAGPELEDAVARAVGRVGAAVDFVRVARAPRLEASRFARVSVRRTATSVEVEILFARGGKTTRSVSRAGTPTVEAEEVALVVESALESELDAIQESQRPPPPPPPPPPPVAKVEPPAKPTVPRAPEPTALALFAGIFGGAGAFGAGEGPVARLGGELGVASSARFRPSLTMRVSYTLPFHAGERRAEADVSVVNLRLVPAAEWIELSRASFGLGLGLGVDLLSVSARSDVAGAKIEPVSVRVDPVLSPTVLFRLGLAKNVSLSANVALDVAFSSRSWVVDDGGTRTTVFEPMRVRPVGFLALDVAIFGDDRVGRAAVKESR